MMSLAAVILVAAFAAEIDGKSVATHTIRLTNEYREEHELPPVKENRELRKAAQYFAEFLSTSDKFDHEADDKTPAKRAEEYGYDYCIVLENIATQKARGL